MGFCRIENHRILYCGIGYSATVEYSVVNTTLSLTYIGLHWQYSDEMAA